MEHRLFWPAAACIAVLLIYLPDMRADLIFDDERLTDGSIFGAYGGLFELKQRLISYGSFVWVRDLLGDGWWKQRFFNVAIHAGVAALLYHLVHALLVQVRLPTPESGAAIEARSIRAAAGVAVLLFAVNPVSVYAVAYLIQRSILMATFFSLACLYLTLLGAQRRQLVLLVLAAIAYVLALLSKEHAVLLPVAALALYLMVRRPGRVGVAILIVAMLALVGAGSLFLLDRYEGQGLLGQAFGGYGTRYVEQLAALSPGSEARVYPLSILNQTWLFAKYGVLWFFPNPFWMSLDLRPAFPLSLWSFPHILGLPVYLGSVGGSLYLMVRYDDWRRLAGFALFAPGILFASEFATVWIQDPFVLYRSYLWAAVGFPLLVALFFVTWPFRTIVIAAVVLTLAFSALAVERVFSMKTEYAAWYDAAATIDIKDKPSAFGRWRPLLNRGNQYVKKGIYLQALSDYEMAGRLGMDPGLVDYHRGTVLQRLGRLPEALAAMNAAEKGTPAPGFTHLIPFQKSSLLFQMGRFEEAIAAVNKALPLLEDSEDRQTALKTRAHSNIKLARYAAAIDDFRTLLVLSPSSRTTSIELAIALGMDKRATEAMALADKLLSSRDGSDIRFARSIIFSRMEKNPEALAEARLALQFKPGDPSLQGLVRKLQAGSGS